MSEAVAALLLMFAVGSHAAAAASPLPSRPSDPPPERPCTADGLVHAEVSSSITKPVAKSIRLIEPGARVRDIAKLTLPCGYRIDPRYGSNLVLSSGTEFRRYLENNAFGFAPPFGFAEPASQSYTLDYRIVTDADLHSFSCSERVGAIKGAPQLCTSFGSETSFFGAMPSKQGMHIAHYVLNGPVIEEDFPVADVGGHVESIFFMPPPDAPGGTITLIISGRRGTYRAYLDTPKG